MPISTTTHTPSSVGLCHGSELDAFCSSGPSPTEFTDQSPRFVESPTPDTLRPSRVHLFGCGGHALFIAQQLNQSQFTISGITIDGETIRDIHGLPWTDVPTLLTMKNPLSAYAPTEKLGIYDAIVRVGSDWIIETRPDEKLEQGELEYAERATLCLGARFSHFPRRFGSSARVDSRLNAYADRYPDNGTYRFEASANHRSVLVPRPACGGRS